MCDTWVFFLVILFSNFTSLFDSYRCINLAQNSGVWEDGGEGVEAHSLGVHTRLST